MSENAQRRAQELECLVCMCAPSPHLQLHHKNPHVTPLFLLHPRFEVDNSLAIDDADAAAEHAQVPPPAFASPVLSRSRTPQLLAADLQDDSLYPELQISVKLPYRNHELFLLLTLPRSYPSAEALRARVRSDTMPPAAVQVAGRHQLSACAYDAGKVQ